MRQASLKDVSELLDSENMDSETAGIGVDSSDPVIETAIRLNLDQLVEYDRNPRIAVNREYETLKESLRHTGSDTVALVVTKRPGEADYFPKMGGNTRIRILKELYDETGDEKYFWIGCMFQPFTTEAELLIGHLAENDNRADYIFLDRARGIRAIRDQFEAENLGGGELSQRKFITMLAEHGYPKVSRISLSRIDYALDQCYPLIPQAMENGLSDQQTRKIHKLQSQVEEFCQRLFDDAALLGQVLKIFPKTLSRFDSEQGIDLKTLEKNILSALSVYLAKRRDMDQTFVHGRLLSYWAKHQKDPTQTPSWPEVSGEEEDIERLDDRSFAPLLPGGERTEELDPPSSPGSGQDASGQCLSDNDHHGEYPSGSDEERQEQDGTEHPSYPPAPSTPSAVHDKLVHLRREAYDAAYRIARNFELQSLLHQIPTGGCGYYIDGSLDELDAGQMDVWWWLFNLSGVEPFLDKIMEVVPTSRYASIANQIMANHPTKKVDGVKDIGKLVLNMIGNNILDKPDRLMFLHLSPQDFESFFELMSIIRQIKALDLSASEAQNGDE